MRAFNLLLPLLLAGSIPLLAADECRQLGVGILHIAQEGAALYIELDSKQVFQSLPSSG